MSDPLNQRFYRKDPDGVVRGHNDIIVDIQPSSKELEDFYDMKLSDRAVPSPCGESLRPLTEEQIQKINDDVTRLLQNAKRRRLQRRTPDTNIILETLGKMAWAKAKAHLEGMLETYWEMDREFEEIETEIGEFIGRMEDRL